MKTFLEYVGGQVARPKSRLRIDKDWRSSIGPRGRPTGAQPRRPMPSKADTSPAPKADTSPAPKADTSPAPKPGAVTSKPLGKSVPFGSPKTSGTERPFYGGAKTIPYKRPPTPSSPTQLPPRASSERRDAGGPVGGPVRKHPDIRRQEMIRDIKDVLKRRAELKAAAKAKPQATTTAPKTTKPQATTTPADPGQGQDHARRQSNLPPSLSRVGLNPKTPHVPRKRPEGKPLSRVDYDQKKFNQLDKQNDGKTSFPRPRPKPERIKGIKTPEQKAKTTGPVDRPIPGLKPEDDNLQHSFTKQERETGGEVRPKRRLPRPARRPASMPRDNTQPKVQQQNVQQQVKPITGTSTGPSRNMKQPRNIRNNNPMNIRHSSDAWQGASKNQTDKAFVQFDTPEHGMRAALRTMRTYQKKHGLTSLSGMMSRWAPKGDGNNDPNAYAAHVAKHMGVKPDHQVDMTDRKQMRKMMKGMISMEGGKHSYTDAQLDKAYDMAFPKRAIKSSFVMNFSDFVAEDDMKGMSVSSGHKRSVKQGAGMTKKGVEAYRRKNPGSKLSTAVTTPPSKLKKGSKAANRRKSFCARSRSWRGPRGLAARRRWNC